MSTLAFLIALFGLAVITQGLLAVLRNARAVHASGSREHYGALLVSLAAGAGLAVTANYVSYSIGAGRTYGFPFPSAAANGWVPWPGGYFMQFANTAFACSLPQLLLRWVFRRRAPGVEPGALSSRHWVDLILLLVTGIALAGFMPLIDFLPKAIKRVPSSEGRALLIWPPMAVLAAWCVASVWIFDSGLTHRGRWIWLLLLTLAMAGFPASCIYSLLYSNDRPLDFRSQIVSPSGAPEHATRQQ
jgi:hypothetical protein